MPTTDDSEAIGQIGGPNATGRATALALERTHDARAVVLVEGISDQIALGTLARRQGRNLAADGVVILPIGGANAVAHYLRRFGPLGAGLTVAGLCDAAETDIFIDGLRAAGLGSPQTRADIERLGFHVCVEDLEDELIRAVGPVGVEQVFDAQGDLGSFRSLQQQPDWRGRNAEAQMRRFFGAGARRKLRYARLLVEALGPDRVPRPLQAVLAAV